MRKYFILAAFFGLTGCDHLKKHFESPSNDTIPPTKKDSPVAAAPPAMNVSDKILDSLQKFSFVIESNRHIDSISKHQHGIAFMIDSTEKEWVVQSGYNGKDRFETYYTFYVNPVTMQIKVYDVANDEKLSIADYLKTKK